MARNPLHTWPVRALICILPLLLSVCGQSDSSGSGCATYSTPPTPDTTPPNVPQNLRLVAVGSSEVSLAWDTAYDDRSTTVYNLYRAGSFIKSTSQTTTLNGGLKLGVQYCYKVSAVDTSGNESGRSDPLCVTTVQNLTPPSVPVYLSAASASPTLSTLSWEPSADDLSVAGYKVYRDSQYLSSVTTTWARDSSVTRDTQYCYTVEAYDKDGNISAMSNTACVTPSSSWAISVIDADHAGINSSIARDSSGRLYIGYMSCKMSDWYYYSCSLKYARYSAGQWTVHDVPTNETLSENGASLGVDSAGHVHMIYQSYWLGLRHITNASGSWVAENVDMYGTMPSTGVDAANAVHIAYFNYQNRQLKYATNASGSWSTTVVDTWDSGYWSPNVWISPSLALDAAGHAHVSYYDSSRYCIRYATNGSGSWLVSPVDTWSGTLTTSQKIPSAIAIDQGGSVHISYYDWSGGNTLRYVTNSTGTWEAVTVDNSPDASTANSLAIDSTGSVHISYHDVAYGDLKYAVKTSTGWQLYDLDNIGSVGNYASMLIDPSDKVHISYFDFTKGDLKYMTSK